MKLLSLMALLSTSEAYPYTEEQNAKLEDTWSAKTDHAQAEGEPCSAWLTDEQ